MSDKKFSLKLFREFMRDYRGTTEKLIAENGTQFALKAGFKNVHFISDPTFLCHILFTNNINYPRPPHAIFDALEGYPHLTREEIFTRWKKLRSEWLNPDLSYQSSKKQSKEIDDIVSKEIATWGKFADSNQPFDIYPALERLTLKTLIGTILGGCPLDEDETLAIVHDLVDLVILHEASLTKLPWRLPTRTRAKTRRVVAALLDKSAQIVEYLATADTNVHVIKNVLKAYNTTFEEARNNPEMWKFLRGIGSVYLTGGFDSTARALVTAFVELSKNPEIADNVAKEINEKIGNAPITPENVDKLEYARATFLESLRISGGILPLLNRTAVGNDEFKGYKINKGDRIILPLFYLLKNPEYWNEPEKFDPTRMIGFDTSNDKYRFIYLPFSGGVRMCAGRFFAIIESTIMMALICQKYKLEMMPNQVYNQDFPSHTMMKITKR